MFVRFLFEKDKGLIMKGCFLKIINKGTVINIKNTVYIFLNKKIIRSKKHELKKVTLFLLCY